MTSIPLAICRTYRNSFKRQHLKNKRFFLDFLLNFSNVHEIKGILKEKMSFLA